LNGKAQVEVSHRTIEAESAPRASRESETCITSRQQIKAARTVAIHEMEVRPGRRSGLDDRRGSCGDFNYHHDELESAVHRHGPGCGLPAAIVHIAELAAVDEPDRASSQARSTPVRP